MNGGRAVRGLWRICLAFTVLVMTAPAVPAGALAPPAEGEVSAQYAIMATAYDGLAGELFGSAVAASDDFMVVGAPLGHSTGGIASGCAYVYERQWATWEWVAKLTAPDAVAGDSFGTAVAVYGDTVIVGADMDDTLRGSAYVFTRTGGLWTGFPQKIQAFDGGANDHFGLSVALYQDTALIGAYGDGDGGGAGYVYTRSGDTWSFQQKLTDPSITGSDMYGGAVALYRDTALIGARYDDGFRGSVFVFTRSGSTWTGQQKLTATDGAVDDWLGTSVALYRDTALIGANGDDDGGDQAGAAYVFTRSGTAWTQSQKLPTPGAGAGDSAGTAVAISGDYAIVSVPGVSAAEGGAAFYERRAPGWVPILELWDPTAGDPGDRYGNAVSLSGGRIAVGAPRDDTLAGDAGAAYFYLGEGRHPTGSTRISGPNRYATAVAASRHQFLYGASTVVIATGENWPDALGGGPLCGMVYGPMLLTKRTALPPEVRAEIVRLGATRAYILGGTGVVSTAVQDELAALLGPSAVTRLAGGNRYTTARAVADEVIRLQAGEFDGHVIVATGGDFPDATAVAPICAFNCTPILLADPRTGAVNVPPTVTSATILGGTSAVSGAAQIALDARLSGSVVRIAGDNRYHTAALIAQAGVDHGMMWNGVGLASGTAFPDALAGGVMLGLSHSVLLLTAPTSLSPDARIKLQTNAPDIHNSLRIVGGTSAISPAVEAAAKTAGGITP